MQSRNHIQHGAFTASRRAKQTNQLSVRDLQIEVIHRMDFPACFFIPAGEDFGQLL